MRGTWRLYRRPCSGEIADETEGIVDCGSRCGVIEDAPNITSGLLHGDRCGKLVEPSRRVAGIVDAGGTVEPIVEEPQVSGSVGCHGCRWWVGDDPRDMKF